MSSVKNMMLLDMNENQYGPAPSCYEVLKNADITMLNSYTRTKPTRLMNMLSDKYEIPIEKILLGNGSEELLKLTFQTFGQNGGKVMLPYEGWSYFKSLTEEVGGTLIEYPVDELEDRYHYDMDKILPVYKKEKPALFMACCPNNPTGNSFKTEEIETLLKESPDTIIIWDQAYYGFSKYDLKDDVRYILDKYPNVIVTRTFSKYYALAGVRIGFGFLGSKLKKIKKYNDRYLGFNCIAEELAIAALNSEGYYENIARKQIEDRNMYFEELSKIDGVKPFKSEATYFIAKLQSEQWRVLKDELPRWGVKIKFITDKEFPDYIRISLGTQEQNAACMKAIKEIIG